MSHSVPLRRTGNRLRAEQIAQLYRTRVPGALISLAAAFLLIVMQMSGGLVDPWPAEIFLAGMTVQTALRLAVFRFWGAPPGPQNWRRTARLFCGLALMGGLCWGTGSVLLLKTGSIEQQVLTALVVCAVGTGAVNMYGAYFPAFQLYFVPSVLPIAVWSAWQGDRLHLAFAALVLLWIAALLLLAHRLSGNLADQIRMRFDNVDMAEDLRRQKELAEQANAEKTRFLASSSHDLRQPVHALGLFVAAMQGHRLEPDSRRMLNHIGESVQALEGLFTSLLDISRLDAGTVEVHPAPLAVGPMIARICADLQPEAAEKGLQIRCVPSAGVVMTDKLLLERIIRNLAVNAVRHTDHGRVLIGCRRGGDTLRIQVWDTGPGIPEHQQQAVFGEYVQLGNSERDRTKGLGLGLAIVRRLSALLDSRLVLRSVPGQGSMFEITVKLAETRPAPEPIPVMDAEQDGLILVIDDETLVRQALRSLLQGWGYRVIDAGSLADMLALIGGRAEMPVLVIADYRLRDEDGIDAVARLRAVIRPNLPALLITGDTSPDRLRCLQQSGLPVLHKPVGEERLRDAVMRLTALPRPRRAAPIPEVAPVVADEGVTRQQMTRMPAP